MYVFTLFWSKIPIFSLKNFRAHPCELPNYPGIIFYTLFVASNPCVLYLAIKIIIDLVEFLSELNNSANEEIDSENPDPEERLQQNQRQILPRISNSIEIGHSSNIIHVKPFQK